MKKIILLLVLFIGNFTMVGFTQNIWEPTNGPKGMDVVDVVLTTDSVLVISVNKAGVYFSKDKGLTWTKNNKGITMPEYNPITLAAGNDGIVYAKVGQDLYRLESNSDQWIPLSFKVALDTRIATNPLGYFYTINNLQSFLAYSMDKGETFQEVSLNIPSSGITWISFNGNGNNFFNNVENSHYNLYRMNDDGAGSHVIISTSSSLNFFWHPAGYLFFDSNIGLARTDREGMNRTTNTSFNQGIKSIFLKSNGKMLALTYDGDYESDDLGSSFIKDSSTFYKRINYNSRIIFNEFELYIADAYFGYCDYGALTRVYDEGKSWTIFKEPFSNQGVKEIFSDKISNLFAKTCRYGEYSFSIDKGLNWQFLNLPVDGGNVVSTSSGNLFAEVSDLFNGTIFYKSKDLGLNWNKFFLPDSLGQYDLEGDQSSIIYALGYPTSYLSKDGGENWKVVGPVNFPTGKIYFHPDGTVFILSDDPTFPELIHYSEDDGLNWNPLGADFYEIYAFCISKKGTIYISGWPRKSNGPGLFKSIDKLKTYVKIKDVEYDALVTDDKETIYAAYGWYCDKSSDEGLTWQSYQTGLPKNRYCNSLTIDAQNYLYAAFNDDVVYKTANTLTTTNESANQKSNNIITIQPNPADDQIFVIIHSNVRFPVGYQLCDIRGRNVLFGKINSDKSTINIESIPNGIYFLKFDDSKLPVEKIVVEH